MSRRTAAAFVLLLAAAPIRTAIAQSTDENLLFARGLMRRGYADLAREFLENRCEQAALEADRTAYALELLALDAGEIDRAPLDQRAERIDTTLANYRAFLARLGDRPEAAQAQSDIGELLARRARILSEKAGREPKPSLIEEADAAFQTAESFLRDLGDRFAREQEELQGRDAVAPGLGEPEKKRLAFVTEKRMLSRYNLVVALYAHGEALENRETGAGRETFRLMVKTAKDFLWDYEGFVVAYDAAVYAGRAMTLLGEFDQALPFFEQAWSIRNNETGRDYADIACRAYYHKAQALIARADRSRSLKHYEEALRTLDKLTLSFPDLRNEEFGKAILIERASALYGLGQKGRSMEIFDSLIRGGDRWALVAGQRLRERIGTSGGTAIIPIDLRVAAADGLMAGQQYREAALQYREILRDATSSGNPADVVPGCFYKMGLCLLYEERPEEAQVALEALEKYPSHPKAEDAAFEIVRITLLQRRQAEESGDPAELAAADDRIQAAMDRFVRLFPDSPRAQDFTYLRAVAEEKQNRFLSAASLYAQVPRTAPSHERALASAGYCLYRQAETVWDAFRRERKTLADRLAAERKRNRQPPPREDEVESLADPGLREKKAEALRLLEQAGTRLRDYNRFASAELARDPKGPESRKIAILAARYYLSRVLLHEAVRKPEEVLDALRNVETQFPDRPYDGQVALLLESRVAAALDLGKVDDGSPECARQTFGILRDRYASAGGASITRSAEGLAWAYDRIAVTLEIELKRHDQADPGRRKLEEMLQAGQPASPAALAAAEAASAEHRARANAKREQLLRVRREASELFAFWLARRTDEGPPIPAADIDTVGSLLMEMAVKSPPGPDRAPLYEKALRAYQLLWNQIDRYRRGESRIPPTGIPPDDFWKTQWRMARCHAAVGRNEEALQLIGILLQDERLRNASFLLEEKAALHTRCGDELWNRERKRAAEHYEAARRIQLQFIRNADPAALPPPSPEALRAHWKACADYLALCLKLNEPERAAEFIAAQRRKTPALDGDAFGYRSIVDSVERQIAGKRPLPDREP